MAPMSSRERMMIALENGRPDRLPCQVHSWMDYYLNHYLGGIDSWEAYRKFDMDFAMYGAPRYAYSDKSMAQWQAKRQDLGVNEQGDQCWTTTIVTPRGELHIQGRTNEYTSWETEPIVKDERDFELWNTHVPIPESADMTPLKEMKERLGDRGIVRSYAFSFGQGSPWQSFCVLVGTESAIMMALTQPDFTHYALDEILKKTLMVAGMWEEMPVDVLETGGGAGSSTVISPALFREFCLPYDQKQNAAFHELGLKVVCHLCGGIMPMLDLVLETGADGLETMTPPSMGGDCDLREVSRRIGDKLFFIGGFDQCGGFENGTPAKARELVFECFKSTKDHAGYICSPSDHFFHGNPENIQAFADAARECTY